MYQPESLAARDPGLLPAGRRGWQTRTAPRERGIGYRLWIGGLVLSVAGLGVLVGGYLFGRGTQQLTTTSRFPVSQDQAGLIPGEFEQQGALLIAWPPAARSPFSDDMIQQSQEEDRVFCDIVRHTWQSVTPVIVVEGAESRERVIRLLEQVHVPATAVQFVDAPFRSAWVRDFGPLALQTSDGACSLIDADYFNGRFWASDPHGDRLPSFLADKFKLPAIRAPLAIQHGNVLSNGAGLLITSRLVLRDNEARGYDADDVTRVLKQCYAAKEVVFLEPMRGEETGHVDMFVTFPSPDTVVVGEYPVSADPVNKEILDRNAQQLASLAAPLGPLNVVRIAMPPRFSLVPGHAPWPTYTNVVYANGVLLVPICPGLDPRGEFEALGLYRRLLPDWQIVRVDALPLVLRGGSLHCVTMNLPSAVATN